MSATASPAPKEQSSSDSTDLQNAVIRFAGNSQDGIQTIGGFLAKLAGRSAREVMTYMTIPSTISGGPSIFQVHLGSGEVLSPGDEADFLVAFYQHSYDNHINSLRDGGVCIYDADNVEPTVNERDIQHVGIPITSTTVEALGGSTRERGKNLFVLGLVTQLFKLDHDKVVALIERQFGRKGDDVIRNARLAFDAGYAYQLGSDIIKQSYALRAGASVDKDRITTDGNTALMYGLIAGGIRFGAGYPITPWSSIMEGLRTELPKYGGLFVQAEDELAAVSMALGFSYAGHLAVTGSSGPGLSLKMEALSYAVMAELPLVVINVQRGGPSTGAPTKTEQGDLLQVLFGRNGESPVPVIAPATPADCFETAVEAVRWAIRAMSPVIILSDGYLANGAEPWAIPDPEALEPIPVAHPSNLASQNGAAEPFLPYKRNPETLARPWALPGTQGLEHRIGGLSKAPETGNVSYDPQHNEQMNRERAEKVRRLTDIIPPIEVEGDADGDLLVLSWGSTFGAAKRAVENCRKAGRRIAHVHLRYINPMPKDLGEVLSRFDKVLLPEVNGGQMALLIQGRYGRPVISVPKLTARPFQVGEIVEHIEAALA
ncbi:2-oxoacid:acceptor oxidoreductase subunit alpha [bacterium]|nr:2-oxoacid:acceptor oxidoreductase subunit alpha [bacterium]